MPQKRTPISSELMLAAAKAVRQHAGLMVDAMIHDFERATGPWHAEWIAIPEGFILTAGALHQAKFALGGLIVDGPDDAQSQITKGLIVAEAVMMGMARSSVVSRRTTSRRRLPRRQQRGGTLTEALAAIPAVGALRSCRDRCLTDPTIWGSPANGRPLIDLSRHRRVTS
jgi:3-carboxy-cis,cis-muconate cycloisomerase